MEQSAPHCTALHCTPPPLNHTPRPSTSRAYHTGTTQGTPHRHRHAQAPNTPAWAENGLLLPCSSKHVEQVAAPRRPRPRTKPNQALAARLPGSSRPPGSRAQPSHLDDSNTPRIQTARLLPWPSACLPLSLFVCVCPSRLPLPAPVPARYHFPPKISPAKYKLPITVGGFVTLSSPYKADVPTAP